MPEGVVKSAARALEVLEFFAIRRSDAAVSDIATSLGYPLSSTSVLVASLVRLGYLAQDSATRRLAPTPRVALLGAWIEAETGVNEQARRLRDLTGETVILAQAHGLDARYIEVLQSIEDVRLVARMGTLRRLVRASTGHVLLAGRDDAEIMRILVRSNADLPTTERVTPKELMRSVEQVRRQGWVSAESRYTPGATVIAARMPTLPQAPPVAVGVGGPTERVRQRRGAIVDALLGLAGAASAGRRSPPRSRSSGS